MRILYYIDTTTPNDFDAVIRFLNARLIPILSRNKVRLEISAELSYGELYGLRELPLEESFSYGISPLTKA